MMEIGHHFRRRHLTLERTGSEELQNLQSVEEPRGQVKCLENEVGLSITYCTSECIQSLDMLVLHDTK